MKKIYAAYGSNLHLSQMALRCPGAKVFGSGVLKDYRLIYRGSRTGSFATIEKCDGCVVPIGLWEITNTDEFRLDVYEGYPRFYYKEMIDVSTDKGDVKAMVYIMNRFAKPGMPSDHYVSIVEQGYLDFDLDMDILNESLEYNEIETSNI